MENKVELNEPGKSEDLDVENVDYKNTKKKKPKSEAAISGQVAAYTLLFLFAFVGLLVWLSGWFIKMCHTL